MPIVALKPPVTSAAIAGMPIAQAIPVIMPMAPARYNVVSALFWDDPG